MKRTRTSSPRTAGRGRPRGFDRDEALERALEVFWRKGYEGASLPELTRAMGINRPSLYAAFGNKEELFRQALDRYAERAVHVREALEAPSAREVAERLLLGAAGALGDPRSPRGCLMVQGALSCGDAAARVQEELRSRREAGVNELRRRFERARREGDLPASSSPGELARYVMTVIHGMAVQAASGASRKSLRRVAEIAMQAWPKA